jgi:putative transcriptional regulator
MHTLVGNLLIAPPAVKGNFWYKTVIMITENHKDGSVGLVLNKRSQMSVKDFGEQLGYHLELPGFVYLGGPVNVKSLSFLHSPEWFCKNTLQINQHYSISSADDILPRLAMGDCPDRWRLFLGMCGWADGQLAGEIKGDAPWPKDSSWCLATGDQDIVFGNDNKDQWCTALDRSGLEFAQKMLA